MAACDYVQYRAALRLSRVLCTTTASCTDWITEVTLARPDPGRQCSKCLREAAVLPQQVVLRGQHDFMADGRYGLSVSLEQKIIRGEFLLMMKMTGVEA